MSASVLNYILHQYSMNDANNKDEYLISNDKRKYLPQNNGNNSKFLRQRNMMSTGNIKK